MNAVRWLVAFTFLALNPAVSHAQLVRFQTKPPGFVPRVVAYVPTVRMAPDSVEVPPPELAAAVQRRVERWIHASTRVEYADWAPSNASLAPRESLALERLRLGRQLYRTGDLEAAEEALSRGIGEAATTTLPWAEPDELIAAYEAMFLLQLERATLVEDAERMRHENLARAAIRHLLRLQPRYGVSPARFPARMVEMVQTERDMAAAELRVARPHRPDALHALAAERGIAIVVETVLVVQRDTLSARIIIDDDASELVEVDATREWVVADPGRPATHGPSSSDTGPRALSMQRDDPSPREDLDAWADEIAGFFIDELEREIACLPPMPPAEQPEPSPREAMAGWIEAGYVAGAYLSSPTRRRFLTHGVAFRGEIQVGEIFGGYLSLHTMFSSEDRFGDLIDRVATIQLGLGGSFSYSAGRFRLFFQPGLSYSQVGRVRASENFWCKVSRGRIRRFDDEGRECLEDDILNHSPQAYFGLQLDLGAAVRLARPLWFTLRFHPVLFLAPLDDRGVDFPLMGEAGFALAF